jgi:hypothetical protein
MYTTKYTHLRVSSLGAEAHEKTCNYWYTVTSYSIAHTAFNKRESLIKWLEHRGLALDGDLPPHGTLGSSGIIGSYKVCSHLDPEEFAAISPVCSIRVPDNGSWTEGKITVDQDGIHTVHHMNCNYQRIKFDYKESREMYG